MKRIFEKIAAFVEPHREGPVHPLKRPLQDWLVALSMVHITFVSSWFSALFEEDHGYFNRLAVNRITLAAILFNMLIFTVITWLLMQLCRRRHRGVLALGIDTLALVPLAMAANFVRTWVFEITDYQVYVFLKRPLVLGVCVVLVILFIWRHRWFSRGLALLAGILSPLALVTTVKIVLLILGITHLTQNPNALVVRPPLQPVPAGQPRVLWIIFDECDQRITFDATPNGVHLPNFDRLRHDVIFSTRAVTPADGTILSLPGLISGRRVLHASPTNVSDLQVELADTGEVTTWKALPSVFADAHNLGVNTAVLGWYHPYNRVLGSNVNYCEWYAFPVFEPVRSVSFWRCVERSLACFVWTAHVRSDYVYLLQGSHKQAMSLVTNTNYGLTFLHLAPPHLPGVYLPYNDTFRTWGMSKTWGYFNNLMLADKWLGEFRAEMEQAGVWDKTWVIVSADHSWRDSAIYDNIRDLRVPYLVKPANLPAGDGITLTNQFNTVLTRGLIMAVLRGELTNADDTTQWIQAHASLELPTSGSTKHDR